ncbi:MAG: GNAT family N-acetyltransferase [Candidatus Cyclobacteriaceae bacterium M2_1C_046]
MLLKTQRLHITKLAVEDASFILKLVNTPGWLQFIGDRKILNLKDAKSYILRGPMESYSKYGYGLFKMSLYDSTSIGICGFLKRKELDNPDIGFAILPEYTRKGYTYEAATELLHYSRETLGIPGIFAITMKTNNSSINLLQKLGLIYQKEIKLSDEDKLLMLFRMQP